MQLERKPGEGTFTYRKRISRMLSRRLQTARKTATKDESLQDFRDRSYDLIVQAYHGYIAEEGELADGSTGQYVSPAAIEFRDGDSAFEQAYHLTYGKPIDGQEFIGEVRRVLLSEEQRSGLRLPKKTGFLKWSDNKITEIRQRDQRQPTSIAS